MIRMDIVDHCIRHIILDGVSLFDPGSDLARGTVNIFRVQLLNIRIEALSHELDLLIQLLVARMISRRNDKRACIGDPLRIFPGIKIKERISADNKVVFRVRMFLYKPLKSRNACWTRSPA